MRGNDVMQGEEAFPMFDLAACPVFSLRTGRFKFDVTDDRFPLKTFDTDLVEEWRSHRREWGLDPFPDRR